MIRGDFGDIESVSAIRSVNNEPKAAVRMAKKGLFNMPSLFLFHPAMLQRAHGTAADKVDKRAEHPEYMRSRAGRCPQRLSSTRDPLLVSLHLLASSLASAS